MLRRASCCRQHFHDVAFSLLIVLYCYGAYAAAACYALPLFVLSHDDGLFAGDIQVESWYAAVATASRRCLFDVGGK